MVRNITQFQIISDIFQSFFFSKLNQVSRCLQPSLQKSADLQLWENHLTLKGTWDALFASIWSLHFSVLYPLQIYWSFLSSHQALLLSCFSFSRKMIFSSSSYSFFFSSSFISFSSFFILLLLSLECKPHWGTGAQGPGSLPFNLPPRPKELFQVFCLLPVLYINKPPATLLEENISFMV